MRIALDAMGGDHAPAAIVGGAVRATEQRIATPSSILLVGQAAELGAELDARGCAFEVRNPFAEHDVLPDPNGSVFVVVPATQVIDMADSPASALRQKPDASLVVCAKIVKRGLAQALVSAGNTGAIVAAAFMNLRTLPGVLRPGLAVTIEGRDGLFTVIDVGANISPKPAHLVQYGVMGACLARIHHEKAMPRVALLNIGGEAGKGHGLAKEVQELLKSAHLEFRYIGNLEGQDVFGGTADVIVCEGFVGNVLLKLSEGLATHMLRVVREELVAAGVRPEVLEEGLARIVQRSDYAEYGGALLLGVEGIVTICHGRSEDRAIASALRLAVTATTEAVNEAIVEEIGKLGA